MQNYTPGNQYYIFFHLWNFLVSFATDIASALNLDYTYKYNSEEAFRPHIAENNILHFYITLFNNTRTFRQSTTSATAKFNSTWMKIRIKLASCITRIYIESQRLVISRGVRFPNRPRHASVHVQTVAWVAGLRHFSNWLVII